METVKFIGLLAFTWLFTQGAAPVQFIKKLLNIHRDSTPKDLTRQVIRELVNCSLCTGFWLGFIFYAITGHDYPILMGCLVSIAAEIFSRLINLIFSKFLNQI